jgi:hypothetical protein
MDKKNDWSIHGQERAGLFSDDAPAGNKRVCAVPRQSSDPAAGSAGGFYAVCGPRASFFGQQKGLALQRHFEGEARQFVRRSYLNRAAVRLGDLGRNVEAETEALLARSYLSTDERVE